MIIISDLEEEVKILSQLVAKEHSEQALTLIHVEEKKLQQLVHKDNGKEFLQKLFEELVYNVIR